MKDLPSFCSHASFKKNSTRYLAYVVSAPCQPGWRVRVFWPDSKFTGWLCGYWFRGKRCLVPNWCLSKGTLMLWILHSSSSVKCTLQILNWRINLAVNWRTHLLSMPPFSHFNQDQCCPSELSVTIHALYLRPHSVVASHMGLPSTWNVAGATENTN